MLSCQSCGSIRVKRIGRTKGSCTNTSCVDLGEIRPIKDFVTEDKGDWLDGREPIFGGYRKSSIRYEEEDA